MRLFWEETGHPRASSILDPPGERALWGVVTSTFVHGCTDSLAAL